MRSFTKAWAGFAAVVLWVVSMSGPANAQKATVQSVAEDVARVRTDLELVKMAAVQVPTLAQAVQDLDSKLIVLEQQLATLEREQKSIPDARVALDALAARVEALGKDTASLRTTVAGLERPGVASPAAGGGATTRKGSFTWATEDGAYAIQIGGYGQMRGQLEADSATSGQAIDSSTLRIRRARIGVDGHLGSEALTFKVMFDTVRAPSAHDFYLDYEIVPALTVRFGQFKNQFIRNFTTSSSSFAFVERLVSVEGYRYDRDVQLAVLGELFDDRLGYLVSVGNGAGRNALNDNIDFNQIARLEYAILGTLPKHEEGDWRGRDDVSLAATAAFVHDLVALPERVGGIDVNNDVDGNGLVDNVRVISATAGAAFRFKGISATAEWFMRHESWGTILQHPDNAALETALNDLGGAGDSRYYQGFYVQGTYMVLPRRLMAGARFAHSRNTLLGVGGSNRSAPPLASRLLEADVLLQLYDERFGGRALGLMYSVQDYNARTGDDPPGDINHRVILETQIKF